MAKTISDNKKHYLKLFSFAKEFVSKQMRPFTVCDLKTEWLKNNDEPESKTLFGNIFKELSKLKLIKFNDCYVKSKFKKSRGRMVRQWISKEYSEQQSIKRISEETIKKRQLEENQTNLFK